MPCPYNIIFGRDTALPCPYNIIFGRDTALPCPLYQKIINSQSISATLPVP